jgi:hypothetical protein
MRAWLHTREPVAPPRRSSTLVDAALAWMRDQHQAGDQLVVLVDSVEIPLTWDGHRTVIYALLRTHDQQAWTPLIQTDFDTHAAYLDISSASGHGILLTSGASSWSNTDIAAQMWNLRRLIDRHAAELDHAGIALDAVDRHFLLPHAALHDPAEHASTWYQLLSSAQRHRLGEELPEEPWYASTAASNSPSANHTNGSPVTPQPRPSTSTRSTPHALNGLLHGTVARCAAGGGRVTQPRQRPSVCCSD